MTFKIGQKVVCINATSKNYYRGNRPLQKGVVYTVDGTFICGCGSKQVSISERPEILNMICGCSHSSVRRQTYYTWRFLPLDLFTNFVSTPMKKNKDGDFTSVASAPQIK